MFRNKGMHNCGSVGGKCNAVKDGETGHTCEMQGYTYIKFLRKAVRKQTISGDTANPLVAGISFKILAQPVYKM